MKFLILLIFLFCKEQENPNGIPVNAKYDRKKNIYVLRTKELEQVWYDSGKIYSKANLNKITGLFDGEYISYSEKNENIISKGSYKNGLRDGLWFWYFPNGKIYYKQEFSHNHRREDFIIQTHQIGTEHGKVFRYYPNGKLEEEGNFDTGYKDGEFKKFYQNGKLEYKGNYKKESKIGTWEYYYSNGNLESKEIFDEKSNLLKKETYFSDGKLNCVILKKEEAKCLN